MFSDTQTNGKRTEGQTDVEVESYLDVDVNDFDILYDKSTCIIIVKCPRALQGLGILKAQ